MQTTEYRIRAAELGLSWPAVEQLFHETRAAAVADHERTAELRRRVHGQYGNAVAMRSRYRAAFTAGDYSELKNFDVLAASLATEFPELGTDDLAAALWAVVAAAGEKLETISATWERTLTAAAARHHAEQVSAADEFVSLAEAAALADVSPVWLRKLVTAGKIAGRRCGKLYLVSRSAAAAFRRHPTAGRPRGQTAAAAAVLDEFSSVPF